MYLHNSQQTNTPGFTLNVWKQNKICFSVVFFIKPFFKCFFLHLCSSFSWGETLVSHKQIQYAKNLLWISIPLKDAKYSFLLLETSLFREGFLYIRPASFSQATVHELCQQTSSSWFLNMLSTVFLSSGWLMLQLAAGNLDYTSQAVGMQLRGDYSFAGLFPLHYTDLPATGLPALVQCDE